MGVGLQSRPWVPLGAPIPHCPWGLSALLALHLSPRQSALQRFSKRRKGPPGSKYTTVSKLPSTRSWEPPVC